jgi:hypothetical protein
MTQALLEQRLREGWGRSPPTIKEEEKAIPGFGINYHMLKRRRS